MSANIKLSLPIIGTVDQLQLPIPTQPLVTQLITPLGAWANTLWMHIWLHTHTNTLRAALLANLKILLVSNATVHPDGTRTCAWVIWAGAEVWSREGYVPSPLLDMYSGLAEAYGIYTVLSFLLQYTNHYPLLLLC